MPGAPATRWQAAVSALSYSQGMPRVARNRLPLTSLIYVGLVENGVGHVAAMRRAIEASEAVVMLAIARHGLGHWPTQAEYAGAAGISERTAARQWKAFKTAFPDEDSPERFARAFYAELGPRLDKIGRGAIMAMPAPAELQSA